MLFFVSRLIVREPKSVVNGEQRVTKEIAESESTVSRICDAILAELTAHYPTTHSQSILTAYLSKLPPDMPAALQVIAQLKGILFSLSLTNIRFKFESSP